MEPQEASRNNKKINFLVSDSSIWSRLGLKQNKRISYIPTCMTYAHTKSDDDPSTLAADDCKFDKISPKK